VIEMKFVSVSVLFVSAVAFCLSASSATYSENESYGFGGPIVLNGLTLMHNSLITDNFGENYGFISGADGSSGAISDFAGRNSQAYNLLSSDSDQASSDGSAKGWNPFLQSDFGNYTVVPEPGTITIFGLGILAGIARFFRKK